MKITLIPLSAAICLTLTACSSGDDDNNGAATNNAVQQWGLVELDTEEQVEIFALFGGFAADLTSEQFREGLLPEIDACEIKIEQASDDDGDDDTEFDFGVDYDELSAGNAITLTSQGGTYSTLTIPAGSDNMIYTNEDGPAIAAPAPSGLTVDIPGDTYPAFMNVSIPDVQALEITSPEETAAVTPDTVFTWVATNSANAFLDIASSSVDDESGDTVTVECTVADDGEFSFPAQTQLEMGTDFNGESSDYSRTVYRIDQTGNTVLVLSNIVDI